MDEEAREQFETALKQLVETSDDREKAMEAVNQLENAMKHILEARDREWEQYIEEKELEQAPVNEENVNLAVKRLLDNVEPMLERALQLEERLSTVRDEIQESLRETEEEQQIREDIKRLQKQFNDLREDVEETLHTPDTADRTEEKETGSPPRKQRPSSQQRDTAPESGDTETGRSPPPPPPPDTAEADTARNKNSAADATTNPGENSEAGTVEETVEEHLGERPGEEENSGRSLWSRVTGGT